jgi:hypothetical protein
MPVFIRIAERDWRDGCDGRDARVRGPKFEVFGTSNRELRVVPFSHVSRFKRHGLWQLADFFSILLGRLRGENRFPSLRRAADETNR